MGNSFPPAMSQFNAARADWFHTCALFYRGLPVLDHFVIYEPTILIGLDLAETLRGHAPDAQVILCHTKPEVRLALSEAAAGDTAILHLAETEADVLALAHQRGLRVVLLDAPDFARRQGLPDIALPFDPDLLRQSAFPAR